MFLKTPRNTGYILVPNYFDSKLRTYPMLHDPDYKFTSDELKQMEPYRPLAMPYVKCLCTYRCNMQWGFDAIIVTTVPLIGLWFIRLNERGGRLFDKKKAESP